MANANRHTEAAANMVTLYGRKETSLTTVERSRGVNIARHLSVVITVVVLELDRQSSDIFPLFLWNAF